MDDLGSEIIEISPTTALVATTSDWTITLTPCQQMFARLLTKLRQWHNRTVGTKPTLYGNAKKSLFENSLSSWAGEIAFCILFNVFPSFEFDSYCRHDAIYMGFRIEIKTVSLEDGWLGVKKQDHIFTDPPAYYALMIGSFPTYRFAGFIRSYELTADENYRTHSDNGNLLEHDMYTVYQNRLSKTIY